VDYMSLVPRGFDDISARILPRSSRKSSVEKRLTRARRVVVEALSRSGAARKVIWVPG
jgi:hypothetical protein